MALIIINKSQKGKNDVGTLRTTWEGEVTPAHSTASLLYLVNH